MAYGASKRQICQCLPGRHAEQQPNYAQELYGAGLWTQKIKIKTLNDNWGNKSEIKLSAVSPVRLPDLLMMGALQCTLNSA